MIHGIHLLELKAKEKQRLISGARAHQLHSNITFRIRHVTEHEIVILASQGQHLSGNYADAKTLEERTRELFRDVVNGRIILPVAEPYTLKRDNE